MTSGNLYNLLGVKPNASLDDLKTAFRYAARRFHPDVNPDPAAADEFKLIADAYAVLSDPARRAAYDTAQMPGKFSPRLSLRCILSRETLTLNPEQQVLYTLVDIQPAYKDSANLFAPPLNVCIVIDRSTSMRGARLDQVKAAVVQVIDSLRDQDIFSVVAYSDKAEVVVPAEPNLERSVAKAKVSTISAGGGTEILEGLFSGLQELQRRLDRSAVNHLMLLTDGQTYGDEDECLLLAGLAAADGIAISGLGIGDEWNDRFLDELTACTGGTATYLSSPQQVRAFIQDRVRGLGMTYAERLALRITPDVGVQLASAFRLGQEVGAVPVDDTTLRLGAMSKDQGLSVLLRFVLPPLTAEGVRPVARLALLGDVIGGDRREERITTDIVLPVSRTPPPYRPPTAIVTALSRLSQYQMQDRAWQDAAAGNIAQATQRLSTLGTRLLSAGQTELAKATLTEARRLEQTHLVSEEAKKNIKYGTRALMLTPKK